MRAGAFTKAPSYLSAGFRFTTAIASMHRRAFLTTAATLAAAGCFTRPNPLAESGRIMTVRGPIDPAAMGRTLTHEHLFSIFGLDPAEPFRYDRPVVRDAVLPHLQAVHALGVHTIVDATAAYFGRDAVLLKQLSEASGLHLITNTGYYGAANDRYVPGHAFEDSIDGLAARWVREWADGIAGTGIRPGFIKLGVDRGPLSAIDRKLVQAGARAHRRTGLTLAVHTGDSVAAARQQLEILRDDGVDASAWIWVHAHSVATEDPLLEAADAGAWISLDGYRPDRTALFLERLGAFRAAGLLGRVLLSHDGNTYPRNGSAEPRPFTALFTDLLPALLEHGFAPAEIDRLTIENPAQAFTVQVRTTD
ncbi:MAG: phosphotriesterase [Bacteroidetes bacterium]|nr:MAG: phosphotriesterase [Bacteroidota bacterium]